MPKLAAIDDISTYRKVADAAYKRGKSGLSVQDEKEADKYGKLARDTATEVMGSSGNVIQTERDRDNSVVNARPNYVENMKTEAGRKINEGNMAFTEKELAEIQAKRKARTGK